MQLNKERLSGGRLNVCSTDKKKILKFQSHNLALASELCYLRLSGLQTGLCSFQIHLCDSQLTSSLEWWHTKHYHITGPSLKLTTPACLWFNLCCFLINEVKKKKKLTPLKSPLYFCYKQGRAFYLSIKNVSVYFTLEKKFSVSKNIWLSVK